MFAALDVGVANTQPTSELVERARVAEQLGLKRLWLAEQHHYHGAVAQASAIAAATQTIEIGFGVLSPFGRHPAVIAMELATLAGYWGDRFVVGLGGAHGGLKAHGMRVSVPTGLREAGIIVRQLLRGERVTLDGRVFSLPAPGVKLASPPQPVPVIVGSLGPHTLRMAAEQYDGALLGVLCSPEFVADRVAVLAAALDEHGRDRQAFEISALLIFSVDADEDRARQAAKESIAFYLHEIPDPTPRTIGTGLDPEELLAVGEAVRRTDGPGADLVPEHFVDHLAVAGTSDQCAHRLEQYAQTGLDRVVLYHTLGPDPAGALEIVARELVPRLVNTEPPEAAPTPPVRKD